MLVPLMALGCAAVDPMKLAPAAAAEAWDGGGLAMAPRLEEVLRSYAHLLSQDGATAAPQLQPS